jgi:acyl-CoA synthetase (AMP-forming)/AMP-acid ligase II
MPNWCLNQLLAAQMNRNPDANAIIAPGRTSLTYRQLTHHINHVVATLNSIGIGRNDRVAIVLPNGPEMAVAFLAVAAGATAAPLNPAYRADEFNFYLSDLKAKALIIQAGLAEPAQAVARARGIPIIELQPMLEAEAGLFSLIPASTGEARPKRAGFAQPDHVALVLHTSGTTSRPKIVPLTQSNLYTSAHNISTTLALSENDRCLNVMPLFHIHGLIGVLLSSLTVGASVVCTPGFEAPKFFEWFKAFCPTWYSAVPTMHQAILARASTHHCPSQLRFIRSSSAALPPQVLADLENVFNAPVIEAYGMTEASHQMASNPLPPLSRKPGSVGMAAGPEIAIMDEAGHLLSSGTLGEIVIRGANVTRGYENNPKANQSAFTNGWFRTGDQGYLDSDGYLFITGRLKEIINRGGEKISPREVDEILMDHPAVAQVVTFAMPHPQLGEEIAAAVVLRENVTTKDIQAFAAARLADFKVPRKIIILDEIPKGPTGKLQRIGLADKLGLTASEPATADFVAPTTPIEKKLAEIWSQVPLSFSQQRMWFLDQLEPGNPAYNRPSSIRLTGPLNVAALEKSLNEIIRRHEVLRTHFPMNNGTAIQVIASNLNLTLSVTDLSDWPDRETEAQRLAASEAQRSFDLAQGPLIRVGLLRLNKDVHVLLLTMHHIVFDGWSMGVLLRELATLYNAFCIGKPSPLAKLPVQYVDFAHWQWLQGETLNTQLSYWKQKLADISVLNLPTDRPRPAVQTFRGGKQSLVLSKSLSDSLKALSQQENVTLFMTLLAAFQILLHRYTGQDDIIVGSPIAGRHLVETEKLIGVFINTLVLRTDFSGNPTFQTLLARVRETALGAYAHQTLPFEKLVEELQPERDLSRTPLFQVLFQLRNIPNEVLEVQKLRMDKFEFETGVTQLDLALDMVDKAEGLSCVLKYNTDLFDAETIKRMGEHFQTLLEGIVAAPNKPISAYSLVTPQSLQLLPDPSIPLPEPPYELATTLFTYWVNRTPKQIAVSQNNYLYTYSELYERAHSLANALLNQGLERGDVVAVFGSRCFGMITSIIGVFFSGGVLLTLENNLPSYRQQLMLREH